MCNSLDGNPEAGISVYDLSRWCIYDGRLVQSRIGEIVLQEHIRNRSILRILQRSLTLVDHGEMFKRLCSNLTSLNIRL